MREKVTSSFYLESQQWRREGRIFACLHFPLIQSLVTRSWVLPWARGLYPTPFSFPSQRDFLLNSLVLLAYHNQLAMMHQKAKAIKERRALRAVKKKEELFFRDVSTCFRKNKLGIKKETNKTETSYPVAHLDDHHFGVTSITKEKASRGTIIGPGKNKFLFTAGEWWASCWFISLAGIEKPSPRPENTLDPFLSCFFLSPLRFPPH